MKSTIYDLLSVGLMQKWHNQLEKEDKCSFGKKTKLVEEELNAILDDNGKNIFKNFVFNFKCRMEELNCYLNILILNQGVQIGLELQKFFDEFD